MDDMERNLWRRSRAGDRQERRILIERICNDRSVLKLVEFWVKRYTLVLDWIPRDDLLQSAWIGVLKAIDHFDPDYQGVVEKGAYAFAVYARHWVRAEILANPELRRELPRQQWETMRKVRNLHEKLMQEQERGPSEQEIADTLGLSRQDIRCAFDALAVSFPFGFEDLIVSSEETADWEPAAESIDFDDALLLKMLLRQMDAQQIRIIQLTYWEGLSDKEIAIRLGMTVANVKQIRHRTIVKLREKMGVSLNRANPPPMQERLSQLPLLG